MIPARPFYMIRHGETVMNALKLSCGGGIDTPLNEDGRRQAEAAALALQALVEKPTLIINSGMSRTRDTTVIINKYINLPVLEDNELREHMLGEWENKPWDDIIPHLRAGTKPEGGESADEFAARIKAALARNLEEHASQRVLFVTHGGLFHSFQRMHGQHRRTFIPNATLHRFDPEPAHQPMPWRIQVLNWTDGGLKIKPSPICPSQPAPNHDPA
ncbi:MAG: phosphoglycerate mutase family protein [Alphaproteobacteria bacterium]|nr:phosphoglycerate mutase family protein [Alphaproteobacteria bacterium]